MAMPFQLSPLPYDQSALQPAISGRTVGFHYQKHHRTYVDTLNRLVTGTRYADMAIEQVVRTTANRENEREKKIFNNAGQVWNHDFYWRSLSPRATKPAGKLALAIERDFGGLDELLKQFAEIGKEQFGSGWAWLVSNSGKLSLCTTGNALDPMAKHINCLLTIDVWEHAYYLDYQNERTKYLQAVVQRLNWEFAAENLDKQDHPVRAAA
jgi:superoxide dismutase, Fe-Mn family